MVVRESKDGGIAIDSENASRIPNPSWGDPMPRPLGISKQPIRQWLRECPFLQGPIVQRFRKIRTRLSSRRILRDD